LGRPERSEGSRRFSLLSIFLISLAVFAFSEITALDLRGRVTDKISRAPLSQARVSLLETDYLALTDEAGVFLLAGVPAGTYQCLFEKDGFLPLIVKVRAGGDAKDIVVDAALESIRKEITVTADGLARPETVASSRLSLTGVELRALPGIFEDVSRALQIIPGVATAGDFRNDLIVRGGSPAENLFMLDSVQLPSLSHFGSQNSSGGGYFGLLNANLVRNVEFYSGGFPAYYGDKLSSITRITLREGDRTRIRGDLNLSLFGVSGSAEGPLITDKGSWIFSLRKDFFIAVPKDMTMDLTVMPEFFDVQLKAVYDISRNLQFSLLGLVATDNLDIEESDEPPAERMTINFNDHQYLAGGTLKWTLGRSGIAYFTLSRTDNRYFNNEFSHSLERYTLRSNVKETTGRMDLEIFVTPELQVMGGLSYRQVEADDHIYFRGGYVMIDRLGFSYTKKNLDAGLNSGKWAAYLQTSYPLTARLKATGGIRIDRFNYIGQTVYSPRLGLSYELWPDTSVHVSYGIYYQAPETFWLNCHPTNKTLQYLRSEHAVFGMETIFGQAVKATAEIYNKTYHNYPVDTTNPYQTLANLGGSVIPTYYGSPLVSAGSGYARGLEISARNAAEDKWSWFIDYAYSVIKYKALDGVLRYGDFDFRHVLNAIVSHRFSPRWEVALKWRLMGGQPYTPFDMKVSTQKDWTYFDLTRINTLRYPAYHRLDLRVQKRFVFKKWTLDAYIDIQNLYNRKNIYYKFWNDGQEHTVHYLPLIPFIGLQAGF
jgi:hypothetical protein